VTVLEATGLPLGLFSHATHDPQVSMLRPGAALLLASKGLVESRAGSKEYGLDRLREFLGEAAFEDAQELCNRVLDSVTAFSEQGIWHRSSRNDTTTLAIVRAAAAKGAVAG